jgi:hypothetical protein
MELRITIFELCNKKHYRVFSSDSTMNLLMFVSVVTRYSNCLYFYMYGRNKSCMFLKYAYETLFHSSPKLPDTLLSFGYVIIISLKPEIV